MADNQNQNSDCSFIIIFVDPDEPTLVGGKRAETIKLYLIFYILYD